MNRTTKIGLAILGVALASTVAALAIYMLASTGDVAEGLVMALVLVGFCVPLAIAGVVTSVVGLILGATRSKAGQLSQSSAPALRSGDDRARRVYIVAGALLMVSATLRLTPGLRDAHYNGSLFNDLVLVPASGIALLVLIALLIIPFIGVGQATSSKLKLIGVGLFVASAGVLMLTLA